MNGFMQIVSGKKEIAGKNDRGDHFSAVTNGLF